MAKRSHYFAALMLAVSPIASAGFPLSTEDTGTLGQGRSKIELTGELGENRENGSREVSVTNEMSIIHGLLDNLNGFFTIPYLDNRTQAADRSTHASGNGDVKFGTTVALF